MHDGTRTIPIFYLSIENPHGSYCQVSYLSVFSPNAGKCGPDKTPCLDTFHAVLLPCATVQPKITHIDFLKVTDQV